MRDEDLQALLDYRLEQAGEALLDAEFLLDAPRLETLESLNSYYIESRYTEDIQELAAALTQAKTKAILNATKESFTWIRSKL